MEQLYYFKNMSLSSFMRLFHGSDFFGNEDELFCNSFLCLHSVGKNILTGVLFIILFVFAGNLYAQETRVSGTLKVHPWVELPVVISTDIEGGLQSAGTITLSSDPSSEINTAIPSYKRENGMVVSVVDDGNNNQIRYFEYQGSDSWLEVFVIKEWESGHVYSEGECISYDGNFYVANTGFTSATSFEDDSVSWNAWGGKDAAYDITSIVMDGDTLTAVAKEGDVISTDDRDHTVATVGYVEFSSSSAALDGTRAITRPGWDGVTGFMPGTSNVVDFLQKVFYPVSSPMITSFNYDGNTTSGQYSYQTEDDEKVLTDHVGTVTIPYSTWNTAGNMTFNYEVTNRSVLDGSDDTAIQTVEIYFNGTSLGTNTENSLASSLSGSFTPSPTDFSPNVDANVGGKATIRVTDAAANIINLELNLSFVKALGVSVNSINISASDGGSRLTSSEGSGTSSDPYLIERTGSDFNYYMVWGITLNDDTQADISFDGTYKPSDITATTATTGSESFSVPNVATSAAFRVGATATGNVANDASPTVYSSYYRLQDRLYCGFLSSDVEPSESEIKALQNSSLKTTTYYSDSGISYTNNTGSSGFFTWAVPAYTAATESTPSFSKTVYYEAAGTWYTNTNINTYYVAVTPPGGGDQSWYWVCIYKASTANGGSIKVKLSN